ncbi:MAG TPA: CHASE2 domain-containing protein [Thermomonas sp.]|nr:CHASE2 domain-containing protein [Thermomonas sp.]
MTRRLARAMRDRIDAAMASMAVWFMDAWTIVERSWRRPLSRVALRLKFAFYPLLAVAALGWLGWDWTHGRSLDAAEDSLFDRVVKLRPVEPKPSGKTVVVEIDECSIDWTRKQGLGGWPWPRSVHADLLDALDRAGAKAVGVDVMFLDRDPDDPDGDGMLDMVAAGGEGRFLFAATHQQDADFNVDDAMRAAQAPGAYPLSPAVEPPGPPLALQLPYGDAMAKYAASTNFGRSDDSIVRDVPLRDEAGGWAIPTLPVLLAARVQGRAASTYPAQIRVNWRKHTQLPFVSAANLLAGQPVCHAAGTRQPALRDAVVLVGYSAAGISDTKPTPLNPAMPGVEVWAEATEALLHDSAIWMPQTSFKYLLAALLLLLTTYAFSRGEPHEDIDGVFVATNASLLLIAFLGLTFFGVFVDIFASVGFASLCFGLCRLYASVQRGRAIGNNDYRDEYDPRKHPWLLMARLRFVPNPDIGEFAAVRGKREYRRLLRRQLYAGSDAVVIEGIVERKSWLHDILDDLVLLLWTGSGRAQALEAAKRELDQLYHDLNEGDLRLQDHGQVMVCISVAEIDDDNDLTNRGERMRLRELLGQDLNATDEWLLVADNRYILDPSHTLDFSDEAADVAGSEEEGR